MNTVDALADAGGKATNFLDTGGKATSETVKQSFRLILQDPRVKVIFVNIFGGLTCKSAFGLQLYPYLPLPINCRYVILTTF